MRSLIFLLLLLGCQHDIPKPDEDTFPVDPALYDEAADRLMGMLDEGWVVSRFTDGTIRDQGDSLLFTGIAMGALDCQRGTVLEAALLKMLEEKHGGVYRHPSIPDDYSLDGLLGLWWGIAHRTARCPEARGYWAAALPTHAAAVSVEPFFGVVLEQVMASLGVGGAPSVGERGSLGSEVSGWASLVVSARSPAYRLHLAWLALDVVDAPRGKDAFCGVVNPAGIALVEQFCGRGALSRWVHDFAYNRSVYGFQRASWEGFDGVPNLNTPAIDLLVALSVLYPSGAVPTNP